MLSINKQPIKTGQPYSYLITGKKINIAIVSPHVEFHSNLMKLIDEFKEIEIAFNAKDGVDFQAKMKHNQHVLVMLMDINISIMEGFSTTQWIVNNCPSVCIMILGIFDDKKNMLKILEAEPEGYTLKELTLLALISTIKALLSKQIYLNRKNDPGTNSMASKEIRIKLKDRELLFLQLCCHELTYKEIANILHISPRTVDNYRENLFIKLGVRTRVGLVVYSIRNGLVSLF